MTKPCDVDDLSNTQPIHPIEISYLTAFEDRVKQDALNAAIEANRFSTKKDNKQ